MNSGSSIIFQGVRDKRRRCTRECVTQNNTDKNSLRAYDASVRVSARVRSCVETVNFRVSLVTPWRFAILSHTLPLFVFVSLSCIHRSYSHPRFFPIVVSSLFSYTYFFYPLLLQHFRSTFPFPCIAHSHKVVSFVHAFLWSNGFSFPTLYYCIKL